MAKILVRIMLGTYMAQQLCHSSLCAKPALHPPPQNSMLHKS